MMKPFLPHSCMSLCCRFTFSANWNLKNLVIKCSLSPSLYVPTLINCLLSAILLWRWGNDEYAWSLSYLLSSVSYSIMLFTIMSCWRQFCKHSSVIACMVKRKPLLRVDIGACWPDYHAVTVDFDCNLRI